jgi:soluble lytic murein transglycosylase-like protein
VTAPGRSGAHRAPAAGHGRAHVVASAGAASAVVTGTLTAMLLPNASTPAAGEPAVRPDPVLTAHEGVLPSKRAAGPIVPVMSALDDADRVAATERRVVSVEKAGRLAAQLAELHAREQREQADRARSAALIRTGGVDGWIAEALQVMDLPQNLAPSVKRIVMAESGGNPHAVNRWDSNARRGTPSRGLMQTVPSTYRAYVHPNLAGRPITDPVANITAGVRYMVDRYGMGTLRAGGRSGAGGGYRGY